MMRHRVLAIVGTLALGVGALALIPGETHPTVATAEAEKPQVTLASVSTPNPDLLRRLDAEVAPSPAKPAIADPVKVAAVSPAPVTAGADLAPSSAPLPDPNLKPDAIGSSAVNLR